MFAVSTEGRYCGFYYAGLLAGFLVEDGCLEVRYLGCTPLGSLSALMIILPLT